MNEKGNLDSLRTNLYKKTPTRRGMPSSVQKQAPPAQEHPVWEPPKKKAHKPHKPYTTWFLWGSIGFFIVAMAVAALLISQGGRTISPKNIEFTVDVPPAIASGESVLIQAAVKNTNPVALPFAELTITFPPGTRDAVDISKDLQYKVISLGPLKPGQKKEVSFEGVLFGTEGEEKEIKLRVEFRPENSNAIVVKEEAYPIIITSAPLAVTLSAPEEVGPGESFSTTITVQTNSEEPVPGAILLLEYPFGYSARDATPTASSGNNVWNLGTLKPGEKKEITVTGDIVGSSGDERFIRAFIGTDLSVGGNALGLIYMEQDVKVSLVDSQLAISVSLDGNASELITVDPGDDLTGRLTWKNNLDTQVFDAVIRITFSGTAFAESRLSTGRGLYQTETKTLVFNRDTNAELQTLDPGERGTITFTVPIQRTADLVSTRNPSLALEASIDGRDVGSGSPTIISNKTERDVQVTSGLTLASALTRTIGSFANTGPWPPQANIESTYTLTLTASNTTNTVANSSVQFILPSYVRYAGIKSPTSASISYDERTGEMLWNIGEIGTHASKTVAVQLIFTPSVSQVGNTPQIVSQQILEGFDRFVQETLQSGGPTKTTVIIDDPAYTGEEGVVIN